MNIFSLLFSPKGKITRLPFLLGVIVTWVLASVFVFVPSFLTDFSNIELTNIFKLLTALSYILGIVVAICSMLCLYIKRFRDIGYSGWYVLLFFVSFINIITLLFLFFFPSKKIVLQ